MDIGIGVLIGTAYRWIYTWVKDTFHWSDKGAAFGFLGGALLISFIYNLLAGGFAGLSFDPADISQSLEAIGSAWAIVAGTAQAWFSVTKDRTTGTKAK